MKKLFAAAMFVLFGALFACVSRADAVPTTTNDWFDASFTALTADTVIAQGDTTGITRGAGSWTAVPTTGTAVIADDADVGGGATILSLSAPGEELTFTPVALATTSGLETVSAEMKADAIDELPALGSDVQGAFTVYLDGNDNLSAQGWTAAGWTNLVYAAVGSLTNAWFTLYLDFAKEGGVRYVRYSVKPAAGALAVLADADGTTWFQAGKNADVVSSVSFSGIGSVRAFSGDELEVLGVATYNGVPYQTFEAAIAAGVADGWANGNVLLLADAIWTPTATGAYNIDVNGHEFTINDVAYTSDGTTFTVTGLNYYWIGGVSGNWASGSNWSRTAGGTSAGAYPSDYASDVAVVASAATITLPAANANVSNLYVNANVSFTGGKIHAKAISGSGKLTMLDGTAFYATEYCTSVSVDVEIPASATVSVSNNGQNRTGKYGYGVMFATECELTGSGTIRFDSMRSSNPLYWDSTGFTGRIVIVDDGIPRNNTTVRSENATHAGMSWQVANSGADDTGFIVQSGTYRFGSLSGTVNIANSKGAAAYGYVKDVIMEVGALNGDDNLAGVVSRSEKRSYDGASIRKVGSGTLTTSVMGVNYYYIKEGVLNIASDAGLSTRDDNGNPGTYVVFEGGTLQVASGVTKDVSAYIARSTSTSPVIFDDEGRDNVWATSLGASLSGGLTKKGAGTLTLSAAPAYTGTTTVEGGVLVVPQGTTIAELSCEGGKLTVPMTGAEDETEVLTITSLAEGTDFDAMTNSLTVAGVTISVASGESGYTVKATRTPQTYTWTGAALDGNWNTPGNWSADGVIPVMGPTLSDMVVFPSEGAPWNTTLQGDVTVAAVQFNGSTTLSNALIACASVSAGESVVVTLGDGAGFMTANSALELDGLSFAITAATESPARFYRYTNDFTIASSCTFTGTGAMTFGTKKDLTGIVISADMSEFAGTVNIPRATDSANRSNTSIAPGASSAAAAWNVNNNAKDQPFFKSAGDYEFGSLNGSVSHNYASLKNSTAGYAYRMVIGALDQDDVLGGRFFSSTYAARVAEAQYQAVLRKVGSGELTFNGREVARFEVNGGTLTITNDAPLSTSWTVNGSTTPYTEDASAAAGTWYATISFGGDEGGTLKLGNEVTADLSTNFVGSTKPISIDTASSRTWAGAIPASNVGGLTKKGAGTLTLSAAPLYTGLTTVEEGTLVVPFGSDITYNPFSVGTLSGITPTKFAYPAGTTLTGSESVREFNGSLNISNVTAIDASAATLVPGQEYVIASANTIKGYNKTSLKDIALTLPDGVDASKWKLRVRTIDGKRCLCLADFDMGSMLILF